MVSCKKDKIENEKNILKINAGNDIENIDSPYVWLSADSLKKGETGEWYVQTGLVNEKVFFENKNLPQTKFYGLPGQKYLLIWKVSLNEKYVTDSLHVSFTPIKITRSNSVFHSTRINLIGNGYYQGKWSISGDFLRFESTQREGITVPKENFPSIKIYGKENGIIYAKWTVQCGSISFSDTIIFRTGYYNEFEALEDIGVLNGPECRVENGHVVELNLGGDVRGSIFERFEEFPALSSLKYLKVLKLSGDGIHTFSNYIPLYYKNLTYFDLSSNYICQIPTNIGELKKLDTLILDNQQADYVITQIPDGFGDLESLKYFRLSSNNLSDLPSSFGNLSKLETLNLWGSGTKNIPNSFGNLNSLKYFYISAIMNNLPETFGQLSNLTEFSVSSSHMTKLPDNFGNLKKLKLLRLDGLNDFETLPSSFVGMDSLNDLYLNCKLKELPSNFGNLKNLQSVTLYSKFNTFPLSLCDLTNLKYLTLEGSKDNIVIYNIPEELGKLTNLEGLEVQSVNLHSVPNSIGQLSKLTHISFRNCSLDSIPSSIGDLKNLRTLNFAENNLSSIPLSFQKLRGLNWINLNGNSNLSWQINHIINWNICLYLIY